MKLPSLKSAPTNSRRAGMTLLELTVVILVVLVLISLTFMGAKAWKAGSDRAACIVNQYKMQQAVRAYSSSRGLAPGESVNVAGIGSSLFDQLVGAGKFVEVTPVCPQDGLYTTNGNVIPQFGELYMTCSLKDSQGHIPKDYPSW